MSDPDKQPRRRRVKKRRKKPHKLPETVGKYIVTRLIGEGGMGRVYRGIDPDTRGVVAIKTILEARLESTSALPRFLREMQILAGLDHPGVVKIRDRGMCAEGHFLVMEFVDGEPLDKRIRAGDAFPRKQALDITDRIASALEYLHSQGIMHRDLKPGNIMVDHQGHVTLVDFGLSRFLDGGGTVTGEGRVIGSPHYLPPEQWRGEKPDHRADVYQLGVLAIELLTGKVPFSGTDLRAIMDSALNYGISTRLLETLGLEGDLAEFLRRCTFREASRRYDSMARLREELDLVRRGQPLPPRSLPRMEAANDPFVDQDAPTAMELEPVEGAIDGALAVSVRQPRVEMLDEAKAALARRPPGAGRPPPERRAGMRVHPADRAAGLPKEPGKRAQDLPPYEPTGAVPRLKSKAVVRTPARTQAVRRPSGRPPKAVAAAMLGATVMGAGLLYVLTRPPPPPPPAELRLGPTVLNGLAAARVEWETDRASLGILEVVGGKDVRTLQDPDGPRRDHQILLEELIPGQEYQLRVLRDDGEPMGESLTFRARGPSISFDPIFTPQGVELHWRSQDPLTLGNQVLGPSARPSSAPSRHGQLTLPGVRPGAGRVTVLAFSPLGSVLPVAWTAPDLESLASRSEEVLDELVMAVTSEAAIRDIRAGLAAAVAGRLQRRLGELTRPFRPAHWMRQTSLVLDDVRLELGRRLALLEGVNRLRLMERRLELAGVELELELHQLQGRVYRWGVAPGKPPGGVVLASWDPPPRPLRAARGRRPDGSDQLVWDYVLAGIPSGRSVTLVVHCILMDPGMVLEVRTGPSARHLMLTDADAARRESLDGGEGWTSLYLGVDAAELAPRGSLHFSLQALAPTSLGRAISIRKIELVDGVAGL